MVHGQVSITLLISRKMLAHLNDARQVGEQTIKEVYCAETTHVPQQPFVFPPREAFEKQQRQVPSDLVMPFPVGQENLSAKLW